MQFDQLGIIEPILRAIKDEGYAVPSPIQEQAIPPLIDNRDLLGCAQTGSGKTAAFAIPILQRIAKTKHKGPSPIRALIMAPTRELALQIDERFSAYGKYLNLRTCVIFGGVSQSAQVQKLKRGVDIVVATPGRLLDLYDQGYLNFSHVECLVLDEADHMLDMGFIHDIKKVIALLPAQRQNLLFSATMPDEVQGLVNSILNNPVTLTIKQQDAPLDTIVQRLYYVDKLNKSDLLIDLLRDTEIESALVFCRTKYGADKIARSLELAGIKAQAIHGNKSQNTRQLTLNSFKNRAIRVLVATDIAARGIDIDALSCVFNYDLPEVPETYIHRIGRTARAGLGGRAVSFCMFDEFDALKGIEKLIKRKIPVVEDHAYPLQIRVATPKPPQGRSVGRVHHAEAYMGTPLNKSYGSSNARRTYDKQRQR